MADEGKKKKHHAKRRKRLLELLRAIERGEIDSGKVPLDELYKLHTSVRSEYQSPAERSQYNYGYMTGGEMMADSPNYK